MIAGFMKDKRCFSLVPPGSIDVTQLILASSVNMGAKIIINNVCDAHAPLTQAA